MYPKIFRLSSIRRWLTLLGGVIYVGLIIRLGSLFFNFSLLKNGVFQIVFAVVFLVILLLALLIGYVVWAAWSYRIEFWRDELRVGKYLSPFAAHYRFPYSEINYVRSTTTSDAIEIISRGKPFQVITIVDGGSGVLISEFEKHIEKENIQVSLRTEQKKHSRKKLTSLSVYFIPLYLIIFLQWFPRVILPNVAWNALWSSGFLPTAHVNNYWIENNGTVWVSIMKIDDSAEVVRVSNGERKSWILNNDDDVLFAYAVVADGNEQPWLLHDDKILHWVDSSWQTILLDGYTIRPDKSIVEGKNYWAIASRGEQHAQFLMKLDLDSGFLSFSPLSDGLIQDSFYIDGINLTPEGTIIVALVKDEYPKVDFYLFRNEEWKKTFSLDVEWIVPESMKKYPSLARPVLQYDAFTIDDKGQLWVVNNRNGLPVIGRFNVESSQWEWSYVEPECEVCRTYYNTIVVDHLGRVWLEGEYGKLKNNELMVNIMEGLGLDVFTPHWGNNAERVAYYTTNNSNYQFGIDHTGLKQSLDGKIWAAGDRLVWIDGNNPHLPRSMPDWFVAITNPLTIMAALFTFVVIGLVYGLIRLVGFILRRKKT